MPATDAERGGKARQRYALLDVGIESGRCPRHELFLCRCDSLWSAATAGAVPGALGGGGISEEANILRPRPARRARWATVDAGGADSENELTVATTVTIHHCLPLVIGERRRRLLVADNRKHCLYLLR
jgi:hypothetical protein